ncbi:hypothetical protein GWO43_20280 [candidate division KSB1 bacterium]|nr:hypothetical protein [candidate division KSB1 bacterium]NIR71732.1 hypothetical protein [candidate division KSB1 bacterium]NIS26413.1 hypothetical protein [candidate division KSB1 bacterium]NIT73172.1 hypothetical protein [candidate division KSB1 bacterium]NIU27099.1 hypothetical protein [candidate division KSB1 bacterium]
MKSLKPLLFVFGFYFFFVGTGLTQETTQPAQEDSVRKQPDMNLQEKQERLKIFLDKIEILGRIEKPQTVFILPGNDPAVDDIMIDRSFFKEIFRSVEKDDISRRNKKLRRR